ncbi:MAG: deoxyribonuclease V [Nitrospinae bacterium]|nr:deoxyribonuclease V [Nitrospinota bacterium]
MVDFSGLDAKEAVRLQNELRLRVVMNNAFEKVDTVAGVDVGIKEGMATAAVVVISYPALEVIEYAISVRPVEFPYVPGLLAFREIPAIIDAFEKLKHTPDMLMVDGQGYAHPRRFGLACHLGVELDLPSIGCGKTRLIGDYREPARAKGSTEPLMDKREVVGRIVRTKDGVKPLFVSIGHRIDLDTAVKLVIGCVKRRRLPEPISIAHDVAGGNSAKRP